MFEVDVKNMTEEEEGRGGGGDQLGFGVLIYTFGFVFLHPNSIKLA